MRNTRQYNLFRWTLRGRLCYLLTGFSLALFILAIGVM